MVQHNGILDAQSMQRVELTAEEKRALDLLQRSNQLQEEIDLSRSKHDVNRNVLELGEGATDPKGLLSEAHRRLLQSKTSYALTSYVSGTLLSSNTIRRASQREHEAGTTEARLYSLLERKNAIMETYNEHSSSISRLQHELQDVQAQNAKIAEGNRSLSSRVLEMEEGVKDPGLEEISGMPVRAELDLMSTQIRVLKAQHRVVKAVASGIVAGSGLNWASDLALRNLVLQDE